MVVMKNLLVWWYQDYVGRGRSKPRDIARRRVREGHKHSEDIEGRTLQNNLG